MAAEIESKKDRRYRHRPLWIFVGLYFSLTSVGTGARASTASDRDDFCPKELPSKLVRLHNAPVLGPREGIFDNAGAFNPTATKLSTGKTILLYRGQDKNGISRIGFAESSDGIHFAAASQPVLSPTGQGSDNNDSDGIEDPRLTKFPGENGKWYLTATAYNKKADAAQLVSYVSNDLKSWQPLSTIVACKKGAWNVHWTKSGAMVTDDDGKPLRIRGRFWMYYMGDAESGHDQTGIVSSTDGKSWRDATTSPLLPRRSGMFDSKVVEPGPHTILTRDGLLLFYNGADDNLTYRTGWALFDRNDPTKLLARSTSPIFEPEQAWEIKTASKDIFQAPNVVFAEGIVRESKKSYKIYYGCADSYVGVARVRIETNRRK